MSEERRKVLEMLSQEKISIDEAERLLAALGTEVAKPGGGCCPEPGDRTGGKPRFLKVCVTEEAGGKTNIRVPLKLIRAGIKLGALLPETGHGEEIQRRLNERGLDIDLKKATPDQVEELVEALVELEVDVDGEDKIRICCE